MPPADLACSHRPPCPGCPRFGQIGPSRATTQVLEALARETGAELRPAVLGAATGFRHRARLAVRGRARSPKIGIFAQGSHQVVDIPRCLVHHPLVNAVAAAAKPAIRELGIAPYYEHAGSAAEPLAPLTPAKRRGGSLRYLQVVVERGSQTAQIVLVFARDERSLARALAAAIEKRLPARIQGVFFNLNAAPGNAILGEAWEHLAGAEVVRERFAGVELFFPPGAFGQSHLDLAERLTDRIQALVPPGACVAEFYAGVGAIGLPLLSRVARLAINEQSEAGLHGLRLGLAARPERERARAEVFAGDAASRTEMLEGSTCVIVDPPRRGVAPSLLSRIASVGAPRLIYVSCGLASFVRDARILTQAGLELRSLEPFALFPHTDHVELVACFDRASR